MEELTLACTPGLRLEGAIGLFLRRGKSEKPHEFHHLRNHADPMKTLKNPVPGENLEDLREQESQQYDGLLQKTLLNPALGENYEDLHPSPNDPAELECQRSADGSREQTTRIPALQPTVPPFAAQGDACACNDGKETKSWALR